MTTAFLLGAAVWPDGPSPTLRRRTLHAAHLFRRGAVSHIVACGGLGLHAPTEAQVMRALLVTNGVSPSAVTLEEASTTTEENIRNARALLAARDTPVVIVSDFYHLPRACLIARRLGLRATGSAPVIERKTRATYRQILREVPGCAWYAATFWPGREIT